MSGQTILRQAGGAASQLPEGRQVSLEKEEEVSLVEEEEVVEVAVHPVLPPGGPHQGVPPGAGEGHPRRQQALVGGGHHPCSRQVVQLKQQQNGFSSSLIYFTPHLR